MLRLIRAGLAGMLALALPCAPALAAGAKAYIGNFKDDTVSVVDTGTRQVVATVPVAAGPHGMAISPDGRRVYVSGDESTAVSVIDTANDKVVKTVEVGKTPHGVALTPDSKLLLVALNGEDRVAFVDTASMAVVGSVPVPKPHTVSIRHDGALAYASSQEPGHAGIAVIDVANRSVARTLPLDKIPRDLEISADSHAVYFTEAGVNAVQVLDPATDRIVAQVPTGASPHYVNLFAGTPLVLTVVQGPGELQLFDPKTNATTRTIKVGAQPHWATLASDGKTVFVTNEGANTLSIVDLASGNAQTVNVGASPRKVVVQPTSPAATARVSINNFAFTPATLEAVAGQAVGWTNEDGAPHAVAYRDGSPGARSLSPGESFTRVFDKAGTYDYFCSFHPYMTGRVVVTAQ